MRFLIPVLATSATLLAACGGGGAGDDAQAPAVVAASPSGGAGGLGTGSATPTIPAALADRADDHWTALEVGPWLSHGITYASDTGAEVLVGGVGGIEGIAFQCVHYVKNVLAGLPRSDARRGLAFTLWGSGGVNQTSNRVAMAQQQGLRVDLVPRKGAVFLLQSGLVESHTGIVTDAYLQTSATGQIEMVAVIRHANIDGAGTVYHDDKIITTWPVDPSTLAGGTDNTGGSRSRVVGSTRTWLASTQSRLHYIHLAEQVEAQKDEAVAQQVQNWYRAGLFKRYRGQDPATGAVVPEVEYTSDATLRMLVRMARNESELQLINETLLRFSAVMGRPIDLGSIALYVPRRLAGERMGSIEAAIRATPEYAANHPPAPTPAPVPVPAPSPAPAPVPAPAPSLRASIAAASQAEAGQAVAGVVQLEGQTPSMLRLHAGTDYNTSQCYRDLLRTVGTQAFSFNGDWTDQNGRSCAALLPATGQTRTVVFKLEARNTAGQLFTVNELAPSYSLPFVGAAAPAPVLVVTGLGVQQASRGQAIQGSFQLSGSGVTTLRVHAGLSYADTWCYTDLSFAPGTKSFSFSGNWLSQNGRSCAGLLSAVGGSRTLVFKVEARGPGGALVTNAAGQAPSVSVTYFR